MKIHKLDYQVPGPMGLTHHLSVIATDAGLEKAQRYITPHEITNHTITEEESVTEWLGSSQNVFVTYFMGGATRKENTHHYATGTTYSVTYTE